MGKWVYLQGVIGGLVDFVTGIGVVAVATETKAITNFTFMRFVADSQTFIYSNIFYRWFILEVNTFSLSHPSARKIEVYVFIESNQLFLKLCTDIFESIVEN